MLPSLKQTWILAVLVGTVLGPAAGCANQLASLIVSSPNRFNPLAGEKNPLPPLEKLVADRHLWVRVGPPEATLSVAVLDPHQTQKQNIPPRGTVLVLHGIYTRGLTMLPQAKALTRAGYRAVLVDLRGQGRSTGEYLGFGVQEAQDLSQVIDALDRERLIAGEIGVWGISYGATTAIHLASVDSRVRAVVAIEPFGMLRPAIDHFSHFIAPGIACFVSNQQMRRAVDRAGEVAGFDPNGSDAADAIQRTDAPVLLVHGTDDRVVPYWNSVVIGQAAPDHCQRIPIEGGGHVSLWFDCGGKVSAEATAWFDRWLATQ